MTRLLLTSALLTACAGHVTAEEPISCAQHSFIEMAASEVPCEQGEKDCSFDSDYQLTELGGERAVFRFSCEGGYWAGHAVAEKSGGGSK